ncbi:Crp/Fnr family transcriptional regulator [Methylobacterium oryzisoli]|uniref:Crp/Fnr family transcriptional regulator n=1 Tax=Methylobacterium oryzisoli TaxID=3385502 RepID=UPI0038912D14
MRNPLLRKLLSRSCLSQEEQDALVQARTRVQPVPAHQNLLVEDTVPKHVVIIERGFACRYRILPDGQRAIIAYLIPGDLCGLNASVLGCLDYSVATLTTCEVSTIPLQTLDALMTEYPAIEHALRRMKLVDEAILREWLIGMGRRSTDQHIAHLFCELLVRMRVVGLAIGSSYELPLTQVDLADAVGVSVVHVNRMLQALRRVGLIRLEGKRLTIRDLDHLMRFANFQPKYLCIEPEAVADQCRDEREAGTRRSPIALDGLVIAQAQRRDQSRARRARAASSTPIARA